MVVYPVASAAKGLSPRVRGNRRAGDDRGTGNGSIPARAGEPALHSVSAGLNSVYPRACGGTIPCRRSGRYAWGLSPRVRGNPNFDDYVRVIRGSIPARAGEPRRHLAAGVAHGVYPRACGGTEGALAKSPPDHGLSPRVRGNPGTPGTFWSALGSIPARAGEPCIGAAAKGGSRVYPRACGGTEGAEAEYNKEVGLSPRVRGNPLKSLFPAALIRLNR